MSSKKLHILLVDDDPIDAETYKRLLASSGEHDFSFHEVDCGFDGLEYCQERIPDCILLDYRIPDIDGLEFLSELEKRVPGVSIATVMLTGQGSEHVAVEAMKFGVQDYLMKGELTPGILQAAVLNAVEKVILKKKVEEKAEELRQFASVAAHDLRSPLLNVMSFCHMLKDTCGEVLNEQALEYLGYIETNVKDMETLIQDLLEYSRVGRSGKALESVDMNDLSVQILSKLQTTIENAGAKVLFGQMPLVKGDKTALLQLFQNIIANSIKYCERVPEVMVSAEADGEFFHFKIVDNGIGIKKENLQSVFIPFKRLHSDTEYKGTGLGLATCKRVIEQHGGEIWIESEPGVGSVFHFTLPKAAEVVAAKTA